MVEVPSTGPVQQPGARNSGARSRRSFLLWAILFLGLVAALAMDGWIVAAVRPLHESGFADLINRTIRQLGTGQVQALLLLLLLGASIALRRPRLRAAGGWGLLALAASGVAATVLKVLIHRPRPDASFPAVSSWTEQLWQAAHDGALRSFPSGESTTTFAIAWVVGACLPALRVPLLVIATLVAAGRVAVGSHHPSDVWAGAMLGVAVGQWLARRADRSRQQGEAPAG